MSEYTGDHDGADQSWRTVLRNAARRLRSSFRPPAANRWSFVSVAVLFVAGVLFSTSAIAAGGTSLRNDQDPQLREVIPQRNTEVGELDKNAEDLRDDVDALTDEQGKGDSDVSAAQQRADDQKADAGLTAVHGPGMSVSLNDAPRNNGELPKGANVDDVVVHQQDVQSVVNALWAGGAEAMTIMDVRVVSTSAVRCVGNTLLLHGRVYSPPFTIVAIGNEQTMSASLDAAPGVQAFRAAADEYGLGFAVDKLDDTKLPEYDGPVDLRDAEVP